MFMKRTGTSLICFLVCLASCAPPAMRTVSAPAMPPMAVERTSGQPQVRVTVEIPASEDPASLNRKGAEELARALRQTGQFEVAIASSTSPRVSSTTPAIGEIEGAEFLIYGAVTEYTPDQTSAQAGTTGGALLGIPGGALIGGLAEKAATASLSQNHVAIDIRFVNANTGRVLNATCEPQAHRRVFFRRRIVELYKVCNRKRIVEVLAFSPAGGS